MNTGNSWINAITSVDEVREWMEFGSGDRSLSLPANEDWCASVEIDPGVLNFSDRKIRSSALSITPETNAQQQALEFESSVSSPMIQVEPQNHQPLLAFYCCERATCDQNWGMGTVLMDSDGLLKLARVMSFAYHAGRPRNENPKPLEGFLVVSARFAMCRLTGQFFEVYILQNGIILHKLWSPMLSSLSHFVYEPLQKSDVPYHSVVSPARLLGRSVLVSVLDCEQCCGNPNAPRPVCVCKVPQSPRLSKQVDSLNALIALYAASAKDMLMQRQLFDTQDNLLYSSLTIRTLSITRTVNSSLPLFQALFRTEMYKQPTTLQSSVHEVNANELLFATTLASSAAEPLQLEWFGDSCRELQNFVEVDSFQDTFSSHFVNELVTIEEETDFDTKSNPQRTKLNNSKVVYSCTQCPQTFRTSFNLKRHKICKHDTKQRFLCHYSTCNRSFKLKEYLDLHIKRIHLGEISISCEYCTAQFTSKSNLHRHTRTTHLHLEIHTCIECSSTFSSKFNLQRHHRNAHHLHTKT